MDSNSKLLIDMLESQSVYIAARIENEKNRAIYLNTIKTLIVVSRAAHTYSEVTKVVYWYATEELDNPVKWDLWGNKRKYRNMALDQVKEIMDSIDVRFISGGSKSYDIW